MSTTRKLQLEIDKTLRKLQDGLREFQVLWDKLEAVKSDAHMRDRAEETLKKELKKLQRVREQVRGWIANPDVKERQDDLQRARRQIEEEMERFRAFERESKTKAFSKEGLKKKTEVDPEEEKRNDATASLNAIIERLREKIDEYEANAERSQPERKHSKGKKKHSKAEETTSGELMAHVGHGAGYAALSEADKERVCSHEEHIAKIELCNRLIDNRSIEPGVVPELVEQLDMYLDTCDDEDTAFLSDFYMYDDIGLDQHAATAAAAALTPTVAAAIMHHGQATEDKEDSSETHLDAAESSSAPATKTKAELRAEKKKAKLEAKRAEKVEKKEREKAERERERARDGKEEEKADTAEAGTADSATKHTAQPTSPTTAKAVTTHQAAGSTDPMSRSTVSQSTDGPATDAQAAAQKAQPTPVADVGSVQALASKTHGPNDAQRSRSSASVPGSPTQSPMGTVTSAMSASAPSMDAQMSSLSLSTPSLPPSRDSSGAQQGRPSHPAAKGVGLDGQAKTTPAQSTLGEAAPRGLTIAMSTAPATPPPPQRPQGSPHPHVSPVPQMPPPTAQPPLPPPGLALLLQQQGPMTTPGEPGARKGSESLFGSTVESPTLSPGGAISKGRLKQLLDASFQSKPRPEDREGVSPGLENLDAFATRGSQPTPAVDDLPAIGFGRRFPAAPQHAHVLTSYPWTEQQRTPGHASAAAELFYVVDNEQLLFAFHFQQGGYLQLAAAKELCRRGWRFDMKQRAWFTRAQEPQEVNSAYERGAYVYFDSQSWRQVSIDDLISWDDTAARLLSRVHWRLSRGKADPPARPRPRPRQRPSPTR